MKNMYGVIDSKGIHTDVSNTERGAKIYATKNGYSIVSVRYNCGYIVGIVAKKDGKKWINQ